MTFVFSFLAIVLFLFLMSVGVIFSNRQLRGSCGGLGQVTGDKCSFCGRKEECKKRQESSAAV